MWGKTMGIMSRLKNRLSHKKENTLKISIVPGVNVVEVTGLIPGQIVEVTATNSVGTSPHEPDWRGEDGQSRHIYSKRWL